jgi:hypothetical protein
VSIPIDIDGRGRMTEIAEKKRLNITITNGDVNDIEELRALLEKRYLQRLSIAQVMKRLTRQALAFERSFTQSK